MTSTHKLGSRSTSTWDNGAMDQIRPLQHLSERRRQRRPR